MKIALIAGGQPRFTDEFLELLNQLSGFDSADLYLTFWTSDWVQTVDEGVAKVSALLPNRYNLAKLQIVDQPDYELPPHVKEHEPEAYPNVRWAYRRRMGMWDSVKRSFDMLEGNYDVVIRCRPDGKLNTPLEIDKLDLTNNDLIFPNYPRHGHPGKEICDQFAIGTYSGMQFYCSIADKFKEYVPQVFPDWEDNIHFWASEHLLAHHLHVNNREQIIGNFGHTLSSGRSRFTDNHFHVPIVRDPTA
jgi:hypothetical protein